MQPRLIALMSAAALLAATSSAAAQSAEPGRREYARETLDALDPTGREVRAGTVELRTVLPCLTARARRACLL